MTVGHDLFAVAERIQRDDGCTYRLADAVYPTHGYAVSPDKRPESVLRRPPTAADLLGFLSDNWRTITAAQQVFDNGVCLGCWRDGDRWVLDISIVVRDLDEAMEVGRANDQKAVWDLAGGESIAI